MGTQFLSSLIGVGVAVGSLLLMLGYYGYKWYKKEAIEIKGESITMFTALVILGGISGYKLAESSYYYAKEGTQVVIDAGKYGTKVLLDAGQSAISGTIKYFSVAILEGVGETYTHFESKWDNEKVKSFDGLELKVLSVDKQEQNGKTSLHLTLEVTNRSSKTIDFKELIIHQLLLLKGRKEAYYPVTFNGIVNRNMLIPPATTVVQEIDILGDKGNYPTMLSTPYQKLPLN